MKLGQLQSKENLRKTDLLPIASDNYLDGVITNTTKTNPVVITSNGHGLSTGDSVYLAGIVGQVQLNATQHTITVISGDTFSIPVDGTTHSDYVSGGNWTRGRLKHTTLGQVKDSWQELFDFTPTNTHLVSTELSPGTPLRYEISNVNYYGIVTSLAAGDIVNVSGAPLSENITRLWAGNQRLIVQINVFVREVFGNISQDLLFNKMFTYLRWKLPKAYLVHFDFTNSFADTVNPPTIGVKIDGTLVSNAISLDATGVWVSNPQIDSSEYAITFGDSIEVTCVDTGGNGDAEYLTGNLIFVLE